ncbi:hypothetical protein [Frondihabitans sp. PhB188]|uniref:hypothetical protein n=1 Tax=Frondihabitans sp. PhB188 TaxID=2485200 RepID=UPI000F4764C4|nr:hypothetical protein [Frondihabitans sp. PhB188]
MFSENISHDQWFYEIEQSAAELIRRPRLRAFAVRDDEGGGLVDTRLSGDGTTYVDVAYPDPVSSGSPEPAMIVASTASDDLETLLSVFDLTRSVHLERDGPVLRGSVPQRMETLQAPPGIRAWCRTTDGAAVVVVDRGGVISTTSVIVETPHPARIVTAWVDRVRLAVNRI